MAKKIPKAPTATADSTTPAEVTAGQGKEAPPTPDTPPTEALKIVISLKEGRGSIGVQRAGCDPFLLRLPDAGLANAIARLPEALVEAAARWREQRLYPKYTRPAPPPAPERRPARPPTPRAARAAPPTPPAVERPRMF